MFETLGRDTSFERVLSKFIGKQNNDEIQVLDVGGGSGFFWAEILEKYPHIKLTIVDPFELGGLKDWADMRYQGTWETILEKIPNRTFDLVTAVDVIEHLAPKDAYLLMYELQRTSRGYVVVYTPNGFLWQPPSANNPYNAHVSGWTARDLRKFGFKYVRGHVGWSRLFGPHGLRKESHFRWGALSFFVKAASYLIAILFPSKAFAISGWMKPEKLTPNLQTR